MLGLARRDSLRSVFPFGGVARKAQRQSMTVSLAQLFSAAPDFAYPTVNLEALERKYGDVAIVYAVVSRKAKDLARAPLVCKRRTTVGGKESHEPVGRAHPLQSLLDVVTQFDATSPWLVQITSMYLDLVGNAFWLIFRDRRTGRAAELYPINPMSVTIYPDRYEVWHYGEWRRFRKWTATESGDLLHFRLPNPRSDPDSAFPSEWGVGPLEASWTLVVTDQDTVKWNRNLVKNDGRPTGMLISEQDISHEDAQAAAERYRQIYAGPEGAGKVLVMGKGLTYERIAMTPHEADFQQTRKDLRQDIAVAFDMNLAVLGIEVGDVGRRVEQLRAYWQSAIVSRSRSHFLPVLNEFLAPEFGDDLVVEQDFSDVSELQENETERVAVAREYWAMGVPFAVVNERLRLGFPRVAGDDVGYIPISAVQVGSAGAFSAPSEGAEAAMDRVTEAVAGVLADKAESDRIDRVVEALERTVEARGPSPQSIVVNMPEIPPVIVNIPDTLAIKAPDVHVEVHPPEIHVQPPHVTVEAPPAAIIHVPAPIVRVEAPVVNVTVPEKKRKTVRRVVRDTHGNITEVRDEPADEKVDGQ